MKEVSRHIFGGQYGLGAHYRANAARLSCLDGNWEGKLEYYNLSDGRKHPSF